MPVIQRAFQVAGLPSTHETMRLHTFMLCSTMDVKPGLPLPRWKSFTAAAREISDVLAWARTNQAMLARKFEELQQ